MVGSMILHQWKHAVIWFDLVARWLLALVFLAAGLPKLVDPVRFAEVIGAYGLLPDALLLPTALLLPLLEVAAALLLIAGKRSGLYLSCIMLLFFIGVLSYGIALGLDIDCGCFGPEDPEHQAFEGLRIALVRDLLLLLPLALSFYYSFTTVSVSQGERR